MGPTPYTPIVMVEVGWKSPCFAETNKVHCVLGYSLGTATVETPAAVLKMLTWYVPPSKKDELLKVQAMVDLGYPAKYVELKLEFKAILFR